MKKYYHRISTTFISMDPRLKEDDWVSTELNTKLWQWVKFMGSNSASFEYRITNTDWIAIPPSEFTPSVAIIMATLNIEYQK